jgi:hypothetical protein
VVYILDSFLLRVEMEVSGDQVLMFQKAFYLLCLEVCFAEQAQVGSGGGSPE